VSIDFQALVGTLNPHCRLALEQAAMRCQALTHFEIEIEHLLLELIGAPGNDVGVVLAQFKIERAALETGLNQALEAVKRGNLRPPAFGAHTIGLLQEAWLQASLHLQRRQVRSGIILLALLEHEALRALLNVSAPALLRIGRDELRRLLADWRAPSCENAAGVAESDPLAQYTHDLTAAARVGKIDPIVGRDAEIRQLIDILLRRRQNNPILVGEPGVGKTAVAEGLALRIAAGQVPPSLRAASLRVLDLALLQAGAGLQGEFEQRLKQVIEAVRAAPEPVILFIDEAHTLIGAGAAPGQGDAANLLKPALARGELRTIAATTWLEYKKYIEKDPALARRFQLVQVEEPGAAAAIAMLRGVAIKLERHHGVQITEAAVHDAVSLSRRFMPGRQLPDKAISVLDTACARVALGQHETPAQVEAAQRHIDALGEELARLRAEQLTGSAHGERIAQLQRDADAGARALAVLGLRWQEELAAVREILQLRQRLRATEPAGADSDDDQAPALLAAQLQRVESGLEAIRQDDPMVSVCVDSGAVAAVIGAWTGIPVGTMLADASHAVRTLRERLAQRVIGQEPALTLIANRIKAYHAGLADPEKPVGVFLLAGPSGVGKTETAYALADAMYGGGRSLIVVNLSEYQEAHTVSQLKGAPPGYVGYGTGGVLTEAVRRKPYSVVLLDEFEKAHPDVLEAFYSVFDKGVMEDGTGLLIDFRNTVILATTNAGPALEAAFRPSLLSRMAVTPFAPLSAAGLRQIARIKLDRVARRVRVADPDFPGFDDAAIGWILTRCRASGAREIDRVIMDELLTRLSDEILDAR
jgi:type VI secretion system protein VasG